MLSKVCERTSTYTIRALNAYMFVHVRTCAINSKPVAEERHTIARQPEPINAQGTAVINKIVLWSYFEVQY